MCISFMRKHLSLPPLLGTTGFLQGPISDAFSCFRGFMDAPRLTDLESCTGKHPGKSCTCSSFYLPWWDRGRWRPLKERIWSLQSTFGSSVMQERKNGPRLSQRKGSLDVTAIGMFSAAIAPGLSPRTMDAMKKATDTMNQCVEKGPHLKGISSSHILPSRSGRFSSHWLSWPSS